MKKILIIIWMMKLTLITIIKKKIQNNKKKIKKMKIVWKKELQNIKPQEIFLNP